MARDEQHGRIRVERGLRAVAVMDVDVDDGDARGAVGAERGGGDRDVVVEAEPHRAIGLGVVAGRPHQRQRRLAGRASA